ncbi:MAG: TIGR03986 family CRISPR-associated RAMP protein, partial [Candidatus Eremiobacterota bacterium]
IEKNKKMPFPQLQQKLTDTSLNNVDIEVQRDGGKILLVKSGDKTIYPSQDSRQQEVKKSNFNQSNPQINRPVTKATPGVNQPVQKSGPLSNRHVENVEYKAIAPYNFIPLNDKVVDIKDIPDFDKYHGDRYTGYIELDIETETPVYIRGTITDDQYKSGKENKDLSNFFSPGGKLRIPGSSLRGLIRTIVEIVSFSRFSFYDDKTLYFRGLADKSNLRREYQDKMSSYDRKKRCSNYKMSAGVLYKKGFEYYIKPSGGYKQILKKEAEKRVRQIGQKYDEFKFYKLSEGYLVVSGHMNNKKKDWLIENPSQNSVEEIRIPEIDVENYRNDITRADKVPVLIDIAKDREVPCFYVKWIDADGNDRVSFGHTGMFRLAYEKSTGEHIPAQLKNKDTLDFGEAIFGNETTFAGRVFFEDAFIKEGSKDVLLGEKTPKILSSPKPTTFQHYLVQNSDDNRQLSHYNSNTALRGYKLYWHKAGDNWEETDKEAMKKHATQYTKINPVREGTKFTGRIRFENLSDTELGALLFAIDLPDGCLHKIGMGKPHGLGSIQVKPKLFISDRNKRYTGFFEEWTLKAYTNMVDFKKKFEQYILEKTGENNKKALWEVERLKELKTMLTLATGVALEKRGKTRYMQITPRNEFRDRPVLPKPSKV